jgi:hypothetical protein
MNKEKNNYETYKTILTKEKYFQFFKECDVSQITDELKEQLYQKYLVKCEVLNRDTFKCQNVLCKAPNSPLTIHHVKWKKNGGDDTVRNCVTICQSCHKNYHRGKYILKFNNDKLPKHINGHIFQLTKNEEVNWKQLKNDMKQIRKQLKYSNNITHIKDWKVFENLMKLFEQWLREY